MYVEITSTMTTKIDLDSMEVDHSMHVESSDELPQQFIWAAVAGAMKTGAAEAAKRMGKSEPIEDDEDDNGED